MALEERVDPTHEPMASTPLKTDMAAVETVFRRRGLPAFTLGYDEEYSGRAGKFLMAALAATVATSILSIVFSGRSWWHWFVYLQYLALPIQALNSHIAARTPGSAAVQRQLGDDTRTMGPRLRVAVAVCAALVMLVLWLVVDNQVLGYAAIAGVGGFLAMLVLDAIGGGLSLLLHLASKLRHGFRSGVGTALRQMPLLFTSLLIVFVADDAWRLFGMLQGWRYWVLVALLSIVVVVALHVRTRAEREHVFEVARQALEQPDRVEQAVGRAELGEPVGERLAQVRPDTETLPPAVRRNLRLILMGTAVLRVALVGLATAAVMLVVGMCIVDSTATELLLESKQNGFVVNTTFESDLFGSSIIITEPLWRLTLVLGVLASLSFAITLNNGQDKESAESVTFMQDELDEAADSLVLYSLYLSAHRQLQRDRPAA
ncbi:hypothetical protein GCM10027053_35570 [Intrasporangium mesophilum]